MGVCWNRNHNFLKKRGSKKGCLCPGKPGELFPASPACLLFPPEVSSFLAASSPSPGHCSHSFCFCGELSSPLFLQLSQRGKLFPYMLIVRDLVPVFPCKNIPPKVQLFFIRHSSPPHNALLHYNTSSDKLTAYKKPRSPQTPHLTRSVLYKVWLLLLFWETSVDFLRERNPIVCIMAHNVISNFSPGFVSAGTLPVLTPASSKAHSNGCDHSRGRTADPWRCQTEGGKPQIMWR